MTKDKAMNEVHVGSNVDAETAKKLADALSDVLGHSVPIVRLPHVEGEPASKKGAESDRPAPLKP